MEAGKSVVLPLTIAPKDSQLLVFQPHHRLPIISSPNATPIPSRQRVVQDGEGSHVWRIGRIVELRHVRGKRP